MGIFTGIVDDIDGWETALLLGQDQTFNESSHLLKRLCGVSLSDKQTENLCHYYGEQLEGVFIDNEGIIAKKSGDLHYAMVDARPPVRELYIKQRKQLD